ncbi:MAG: response regulator [Acidobacteria bacterium]|nr:response regulator [Acidobacteriota bacterium]
MNVPLRETILVVAEPSPVRTYLEQVLTGAGYDVLSASGPEDALAKSRTYDGPIDLLVSGLWLPTMTGVELRRAMAADRPGLRALYCSLEPLRSGEPNRPSAPPPAALIELVRSALNEAA